MTLNGLVYKLLFLECLQYYTQIFHMCTPIFGTDGVVDACGYNSEVSYYDMVSFYIYNYALIRKVCRHYMGLNNYIGTRI